MNKNIRITGCIFLLSTLCGCSALTGMPTAASFPDASQGKIQSAAHWDVIAADIAAQIVAMRNQELLADQPLYIDDDAHGVFSRTLQSMLITRLVNAGVPVSPHPRGALALHYETQVIRHPKREPEILYPSKTTALATGVLVARHASGDASTVTAGLLAGADLLRAYALLRQPTRTEIVVTTTIRNGDRFALRKTDVYYVLDKEAHMYADGIDTPAKSMGVRGQ